MGVMDAEDAIMLQAIQLSLSLDAGASAAVSAEETSASAAVPMPEEVTQKIKKKRRRRKKKKKKSSYKNFLKSVMSPTKNATEIRTAHQTDLRKNLGGGSFDKIRKI